MDAATKSYCILGNPVGHSLSPVMHNAAFKAMEINSVYTAHSVNEPDLEKAVNGIRALGVSGASVTIPFKEKIVPYLDQVTDIARMIGSVNTLFWDNDKLTGTNTDAIGFYKALSGTIAVKNRAVALFGSGGSARAVLFGSAYFGDPKKIYILARNEKKALELKQNAETVFNGVGKTVRIELVPMQSWKDIMKEIDIIVNTTPVGMVPDIRSSILKKEEIPEGVTVMDLVYRPHRTKLLLNAAARECNVVYGIDMLLYQGAEQFRLWTGKKPPLEVMKRALKKAIEG